MTIITDFSQIVSAAIFVGGEANECAKHPSEESKRLIKHFIINSARANYMTQKAKYGKMIIACDSGSWRFDVFPQYKHKRKLKRLADDSGINWNFVNEVKDEVIDELDRYFPFAVVKCPSTEGDDVIGVLTKYISAQSVLTEEENIFGDVDPEPILIISSDGDNFQLHEHKNVKQWSPMEKKLLKPPISPRESLIRKIVKGDTGDGIMNIKMGDNTFVDDIRQKPIAEKFLDTFLTSKNPIEMCLDEQEKIRYARNELLVSYSKIPTNISEQIISCYNSQLAKKHSKMQLMNYLVANKMTNLLSQIHDFY